jgi:hypothetical protein
VFFPGELFQPSLIFASKVRAYPLKHLSVSLLKGRLVASLTIFRLDKKGLSWTNTDLSRTFMKTQHRALAVKAMLGLMTCLSFGVKDIKV